MGESNGDWGSFQSEAHREAWDRFERLPSPGVNAVLDTFCKHKNLTIDALVRVGARLSRPNVLAFGFEGGIKFRNMQDGRRWSFPGSTFGLLKIIEGKDRTTTILTEGETDAARLTMLFDTDVAIMPAGAKAWFPKMTDQVRSYERILVGTDNDQAGNDGFAKIKDHLPQVIRFAPPEGVKDWCQLEGDPPALPDTADSPLVLVSARELLSLPEPEHHSWFDGAILPVGGSAVVHGTFKSYKTWVTLAMASALAQGKAWCFFENVEEPARVAYINFEVPWAYYRQRVQVFAHHAENRDLFMDNFFSYSPLSRPRLVAGNRESEDTMIYNLVEGNAQVVFIDPIRRAMGLADFNAENEARKMLSFAQRLSDEHAMTVVLVHHDNKDSDKVGGGDPSGMTGSGAWAGDVDTIISIERPKGVERQSGRRNAKFLLRNAPSPGPRGFELRDDATIEWHRDPFIESEADEAQGPRI